MIKNVFSAIGSSAKRLVGCWRGLGILILLYAALLFSTYMFFTTGQATAGQVVLSFALPIVAIVLFFALQVAIARFGIEDRAPRLLGGAFKDFWKLVVISIPVALLVWAVIYSAGRIDSSFKPTVQQAARALTPRPKAPGHAVPSAPVPWQVTLTWTVAYVLLLAAFPLMLAQVWAKVARLGFGEALRSLGRTLARAFAPRAVLTYAFGFIFFAVVPYLLVFVKTPAANAWIEAGLLAARLIIAALLTLLGWTMTVGALSELADGAPSRAGEFREGAEHAAVST